MYKKKEKLIFIKDIKIEILKDTEMENLISLFGKDINSKEINHMN